MPNASQYEEQILKEIRSLPKEALPKMLRLITVVREEFLMQEMRKLPGEAREKMDHEKTRQLLSSSKSNWAQELIAEREDRL